LSDFVVGYLLSSLRQARANESAISRISGLLLVAGFSCLLWAQENHSPTFHSETTVVLVPTLVTDQNGEVIYGLTQKDFVIEDNGVERPVLMDDTFSTKSVSLVLAIETGGSAPAVLGRGCALQEPTDELKRRSGRCHSALHEIGTMLETFVDGPGSDMALVSFDSEVKLQQSFTTDVSKANRSLDRLPPGDDGSAILDAMHYSLELLKGRSGDRRKVLVVVSEQADSNSKTIGLDEAARQIIASDVEVYMITFPADSKAKLESAAKLFGPLLQQELLREEVAGGHHGWASRGAEHAAGSATPAAGVPRGGGGGHQGQAGGGLGSSAASAAGTGTDAQSDGSVDGGGSANAGSSGLSAAGAPGVSPGDLRASSGRGYGLGPRNVDFGGPILSLIKWSASQMHTNVPQAVANLTGGEYVLFHNERGLDEALGMLANHAHNRYQLSFQVKNPSPGPHTIRVSLRDGSGAIIWARAGYWATASSAVPKAGSGNQKSD
jgi:VWFA-related protein